MRDHGNHRTKLTLKDHPYQCSKKPLQRQKLGTISLREKFFPLPYPLGTIGRIRNTHFLHSDVADCSIDVYNSSRSTFINLL